MFVVRRILQVVLVVISILALADGSSAQADTTGPLVVPLIKLRPRGSINNDQLFIRLLGLGNRKINQPIKFDTGSHEMTVDCMVALPAKLCSPTGIRIDHDTEIDGIYVTTQRVVIHYGNGFYIEYGNLATAVVSFGDPASPVSTSYPIRFVIRYNRAFPTLPGFPVNSKNRTMGIFGAASIGQFASTAPGSPQSPLRAVRFSNGLDSGYVVEPLGRNWRPCILNSGQCPEVPALKIGVSPADLGSGADAAYIRTNGNEGFPTIPTCVTLEGKTTCGATLIDTGAPGIVVPGWPGTGSATRLPVGKTLIVNAPHFGSWTYTTKYTGEVAFDNSHDLITLGIEYFSDNGLAVDFDKNTLALVIPSK